MAFSSGVFTSTSGAVNGDGIFVGNKANTAAQMAYEKKMLYGNGISLDPTSAFYVEPKTGLTFTVKAGWGIMEGYWFRESTDYDITLNSSTSEQTFYIGVRLDVTTGEYTDSHVAARTTFVAATDRVFAIIVIPANAVTLTTAMISDKRYDPAYCGTINAARVALEALQTEYAGKLAVLESTGIPIHASTHATGGDDPVTPASIGAADTSHADTHVIGGTDALNAMPYDAVPTNLLINENFDFWQYGTSFSATGYTADRWKLTLGTSMAITATQQAFTVGQTDVPDEPTYFMQLAISNAGSADGFFEQRIESVRTRAGATIAYSFYAKCTATTYGAKVRMVQNFGTGGSVDVATADQDITLTTSWQKFTGTFTLDSISGKTIGADNYLALRIVLPTASGTKTIQIAKGQANRGTVALPSVSRNQTDGLRLCQRYCQLVSFNTLAAIYSTGFARTTSIGFPSMRVAPTCTVTSISFIGKDGTPSTLYLAQSDFNSISLIYNWTGGTVGKAFTATGALALKSEL